MSIEQQMGRTQEQVEDELLKRMERCNFVINGLQNYEPFRAILADFETTLKNIDRVWHLTSDLNKLNELRITKLAATSLLNSLDNYKFDLEKCTKELAEIQNPDKIISRDVDND